jgi:hypothetical protein
MSYSIRHERILLGQEKTLKKRHAAHERLHVRQKTRAVEYYENQLRGRDNEIADRDARLFEQECSYADHVAWAALEIARLQSTHSDETSAAQAELGSLRAQTNDTTSRNSGLTEQLKSSREEIVELTRIYNADIARRKTEQTARDKDVNGRFRDYQETINNQKTVLNKQLEKIAQQEQEKASQQAEHREQIAASHLRHEKAIQSCINAYNALQRTYNKNYATLQEKISTQAAEHEKVAEDLQDNYNRVKGYLVTANEERDSLQVKLQAANKEWDDCQDLWLEGFFERDRLQDALQEATADYDQIRGLMTEATAEYDRTQGGLMGSRESCGKTSMTLCAGCTVMGQGKPHRVTLPTLVPTLVLMVMMIRVGYCRTHGVVVRTYSRHVPCS